jgi:ABC-type lipoprotein release transport system permease subunit
MRLAAATRVSVAAVCAVVNTVACAVACVVAYPALSASARLQAQPSVSSRGIAIDTRMAEDFRLRVGDTVRLSAVPGAPADSAVIRAIFERKADPAEVARREYRIRTHLGQLQQLLGADDRVDRFAVGVREGVPVDSAVAQINHVAFGFRAHPSKAVAVKSSRTFQVVERFHTAIGIITVVASAVFLLCLLLLSVEERKRDVAALRLLGISQGTVVRAIVIEAAIVSLIGSALGAVIGWVASFIVNAHFQQVYRTPLLFALLTPKIFAFATLLSLTLGIGAGAAAAWRLVRTPPLALMGR